MAKQRPHVDNASAQEQTGSIADTAAQPTTDEVLQSATTTESQQPDTNSLQEGSQQTDTSQGQELSEVSISDGNQAQQDQTTQDQLSDTIQNTEVTGSNDKTLSEDKIQEPVKAAEIIVQEKEVVTQPAVPAPAVVASNNTEVAIPADIAEEVKPDMVKFLEHYSQTASPSSKAWARNILNTGIKFKRKRPIDMKGCLECTMFALTSMQQSIAYAEEAQTRMRFIKACFLYVDNIFDLELIGRGANQLTEQQYKQYMALSNMFHYWASLNDGAEVMKRYNVTKELTAAFDPAFAQRAASIVGA